MEQQEGGGAKPHGGRLSVPASAARSLRQWVPEPFVLSLELRKMFPSTWRVPLQ